VVATWLVIRCLWKADKSLILFQESRDWFACFCSSSSWWENIPPSQGKMDVILLLHIKASSSVSVEANLLIQTNKGQRVLFSEPVMILKASNGANKRLEIFKTTCVTTFVLWKQACLLSLEYVRQNALICDDEHNN